MDERTHPDRPTVADRTAEWFVPQAGPARLRAFVGLLFLPYTGMVLAYTVIGAVLAPSIHWDRVGALLAIYFLALGIGAHALDALGSRAAKPWGARFAPTELRALAACSLVAAYAIGAYYMLLYTPLLWPIAIAEGFFVLAYNLEWFGGRFHTDGWFALSWGALPVVAGYVLQTNALAVSAIVAAGATAMLSLVEIKASRRYKVLRQSGDASTAAVQASLEAVLKALSAGVVLLGAALALARWNV